MRAFGLDRGGYPAIRSPARRYRPGRRYFHWHDNGALMWTWQLTLAVSAVGLLLIGTAVAVWQARAPGEADSGDQTYMLLGPLGVAALIVVRVHGADRSRPHRRRTNQPVTADLAIRAQLMEEGGPELHERFMAELREEHLDIPAEPAPDGKTVRERLRAAYLGVTDRHPGPSA